MIFISEEELKIQGIDYKSASNIRFQNKIFTRGLDISKKSIKQVNDFCQEYISHHRLCLVVEHQWYYTVWIEKKDKNLPEISIEKSSSNSYLVLEIEEIESD